MTGTRWRAGSSGADQGDADVRFVERETLPRHDRGIDWGESRRLIARKGEAVRLFVVTGHWRAACGVRGFGRVYVPAALVLYRARHERFAGHASDTLARGRISRTMLVASAASIDSAFGTPGLAARLDLTRTAVVGA
jgi:hypothetical protein